MRSREEKNRGDGKKPGHGYKKGMTRIEGERKRERGGKKKGRNFRALVRL